MLRSFKHQAQGWAQAGEIGTREKEHPPLLTVWMVRGGPRENLGSGLERGWSGPEEGRVVLILYTNIL